VTETWRTPEFQRDLKRLLRHARETARRGPRVQVGPGPASGQGSIIRFGGGPKSYVIEDEAMPLLRSLQRRAAGRSRASSGISPDEANVLLVTACDEAVAGTIVGAVDSLIAKLESTPETWVIAEPVRAFFPTPRLVVGRTTYSDRIPRSLAPHAMRDELLNLNRFVPPIAFTRVTSRGAATAQVLARERFAESAAVLDLAARPKQVGSEVTLVRRGDGSGSVVFGRAGWIVNDSLVEGRGRLVPPYRQLSRAAARDEGQRSDWERRLLAATRWFSRSCRSAWPADRLASAMVALESLFILGRTEPTKGALIAKRLTERFSVREMTVAGQERWLKDLYAARNDAVHEGRDFVNDLDVDRLVEVTRYVIQSLAVHLIPAHRPSGRSCRTYEQAMRCRRP
jgi:hypothetical protein